MTKNDFSPARPQIMHIDLNSCFASVEQQARPRLRGRPVAIVNRRTEHTAIVTASYEAKARGIKVGMKLRDAKRLCPGLVGLESDPPKYRYVYRKLLEVMQSYSPEFAMKSIDEGVIDFSKTTKAIQARDMEELGREIKERIRWEIGCSIRCNIGISTNRFLAKMAAGLHKPDGMDVLTSHNIREVFGTLKLTDLTGIAQRNERRLNAVGIYTPLQFLDASAETLAKVVFKSVCGYRWYQRLRGWEVDDEVHDLKTAGRQYVLEERNLPRTEVAARLHALVEATGAKLRTQGKSARGVAVYLRLAGAGELMATNGRWGHKGGYWHKKFLAPLPFFSDQAIWAIASQLFAGAPQGDVREIGVHVYHLHDDLASQLTLFGDQLAREQQLVWAVDQINARYGERTIHSADTMSSHQIVKTKIPFGSTRYL